MEMSFEQAEAMLTAPQKERLARLMWDGADLPQDLSNAEKVFCFGLYVFCEYEDRDELKKYFTP